MYHFDIYIDRSDTDSTKWNKYAGTEVLPFWVADMDFATPQFVLDAVHERLDHPILGYAETPPDLVSAFIEWAATTYSWTISEDWLVWLPGVVPGLNLAGRALGVPGDSIVVPTPVYHPFLSVPRHGAKRMIEVELDAGGWTLDPERIEKCIDADTCALLLCNPQNPTGRVYTRDELLQLAEICVRRNIVLVSDEIHCELILDADKQHIPVGSLSGEIADRSITLYGPNKTYNIAGLGSGVAVIPNASLRRRFKAERAGLTGNVSALAYAAAGAAYADRTDYTAQLCHYLRGNRDALASTINALEGVIMTHVEGTYLAWLDFRARNLEDPMVYLEQRGLGLSNGADFGAPGYLRFNFACPESLLQRGIDRLRAALESAP